jgi:hypothetical protein
MYEFVRAYVYTPPPVTTHVTPSSRWRTPYVIIDGDMFICMIHTERK